MTEVKNGKYLIRRILIILFLSLAMGTFLPGARLGRVSTLAADTAKVKNGWDKSGAYYFKKGKIIILRIIILMLRKIN